MRALLVVASSPIRQARKAAVGTTGSFGSSAAAVAAIHTGTTSGRVVQDPDKLSQRRDFTSLNQETPYTLCFLRHGQVREIIIAACCCHTLS